MTIKINRVTTADGLSIPPHGAKPQTHTPTPWEVLTDNASIRIMGANDLTIASIVSRTEDADADAAFIVKCVNAHEKLLAALQEIKSALHDELPKKAMRIAEQAIAAAEGGKP